jgi:DNA-binding transcriptional MerR regulator
MRRLAEFTRAPLAVMVSGAVPAPALEVWRNGGAGVVLVPAASGALAAVVAATQEVPPPPEPAQEERPMPLLPQRPAQGHDDDDDLDVLARLISRGPLTARHAATTLRSLTPGGSAPYHRAVVQRAAPRQANPDVPSEARFQIGEVAERTGVTQRTLRFYEEKGLLRPPERMDGGFRLYSEADIERITAIRNMQSLLGMTLAEIKEMVEAEELRAQIRATFRPDRELPDRKERVETVIDSVRRQLAIVESKLEALTAMRKELRERLATTEERRRQIIEAIESGVPLAD